MKLKFSKQLLYSLIISSILINLSSVSSAQDLVSIKDGKLLRSEPWQPFDVSTAKGDFYVSPKGNDNWSGTLAEPNSASTDGPFATIMRAKIAVRELKTKVYLEKKGKPIDANFVGTSYQFWKGKDIVVLIRQGIYTLTETLIFTPEDGGERVETNLPSGAFEWHHLRDNFVTYAAYPDEKPVISGATSVTDWKKEGNRWVASFKQGDVSALIANGKKQTLARTPNSGYFNLRETPSSSSEIPFNSGDIKNWNEMMDNRIVILLRWRTAYNSINKIDEKKQIAFLNIPEDGPNNNNGLLVVPPRYYIENVKELLDAPGEWFFDQTKKEISYLPMEGITDPNQANLSVPQINQLVHVKGDENRPVRNLRFYGLVFEGAKENFRDFPHYYEVTPGCIAVSYEYASDCELVNSELRACGGLGMTIGFGCFNTRILGNRFDGLEQGALRVSSTWDMKSGMLNQLTRETTISKNIFSECGLGGGITLGVGGTIHTTISHNYFTKSGRPYTIACGAGTGGLEGTVTGDLLIENNHFDDVQHDADDAGVIVVTGMTFNSKVRNNLIHGVHRGFFSDNVAFWFDNMSSNWSVTNNIYYDIEQGEMKLQGTYLIDNNYADNFSIEPPLNAPEQIIEGDPQFTYSNLRITLNGKPIKGKVPSGSLVKVWAEVSNSASSGVAPVTLYIDRKAVDSKSFPVIRNNTRTIEYDLRLGDPGQMAISIGETKPQTIVVEGDKPKIICDNIQLSELSLLAEEKVSVSATAINMQTTDIQTTVSLYANRKELKSQSIELRGKETKKVIFEVVPEIGNYPVSIGNSDELMLKVLKFKELNLKKEKLHTYISPKAKPANVEMIQKENRYIVKASGWDFYHAEDAYATVYLKQLSGDFVASVKIVAFGNRTNEWYRAGLFVRNDISKSFDVDRGSKGSVLMFSTPGRAGIEYDEFGDGCMHKAASENLPENSPTPIWIRLERHGDRFTGYISLDGINWIIKRQTNKIPDITKSIDLGLAAGSPDQKQYSVEFEEWKVKVEVQ